jgi:hypothetical protein
MKSVENKSVRDCPCLNLPVHPPSLYLHFFLRELGTRVFDDVCYSTSCASVEEINFRICPCLRANFPVYLALEAPCLSCSSACAISTTAVVTYLRVACLLLEGQREAALTNKKGVAAATASTQNHGSLYPEENCLSKPWRPSTRARQ